MKKEDLRIVFMGTPEFAVESLRLLVDGGYNVVGVVTQPDKPVGRHQDTLQPSEVKRYALSVGLPVLQPVKMKDPEFIRELSEWHADLQVVVAFRMLPEVVWSMPRYGTFNVHAALLPQYRGAAPINWAIINGETMTGVTTFFIDKDIDTGRIIGRKTFAIPDDADAEYVYDGLMHLGAQLCVETVDMVISTDGRVESIPQPQAGELKAAPKIFKETCQINWQQPAKHVYDFIRGLSPYPGAWTTLISAGGGSAKSTVMKIFKTAKTALEANAEAGTIRVDGHHLYISCADFWLEITSLQMAGKRRMEARDFLNGMRNVEDYRAVNS